MTIIVGMVIMWASREAYLISKLLLGLLMLSFEFDKVDALFESRSIIEQTDGQKEETESIDTRDYSIESGEPGWVVDYIWGGGAICRWLSAEDEGNDGDYVSDVCQCVENDEERFKMRLGLLPILIAQSSGARLIIWITTSRVMQQKLGVIIFYSYKTKINKVIKDS